MKADGQNNTNWKNIGIENADEADDDDDDDSDDEHIFSVDKYKIDDNDFSVNELYDDDDDDDDYNGGVRTYMSKRKRRDDSGDEGCRKIRRG